MKSQKIERKFVLGGEMKTEQGETLKEIVKQYYGAGTQADKKTIDECIKNVEAKGFLDECRKVVAEQERKRIHIGKLHINKVACLAFLLCTFLVVSGFTMVISYIKSVHIVEKDEYSTVEFEYNDNSNSQVKKVIEEYYKPAWVPEEYHIVSEIRTKLEYSITYENENGTYRIYYTQTTPAVKHHFDTKNGKHESVFDGKYFGEYVETKDGCYLVVTDGTYLYCLYGDIAGIKNKDTLIKMLK